MILRKKELNGIECIRCVADFLDWIFKFFRKMSVNFGNRFAKSSKPHLGDEDSTLLDSLPQFGSSDTAVMEALFADTPTPHRVPIEVGEPVSSSSVSSFTSLPPIGLPRMKSRINLNSASVAQAQSVQAQSVHLQSVQTDFVQPDTVLCQSDQPYSDKLDDIPLKLPDGWVECYSGRQQRHYWFNSNTGESVWIRPTL